MANSYPETASHVVVYDNDETAWWDSATKNFGGDDTVVASAIMHAKAGLAVQLGHIVVGANNKSDLGIAGALASYNPGRAYFELAPQEVVSHAFTDDSDQVQG
ncbi:hypothetical protein [Glutamicibacter ardleyensis]|uniref:hypothetical protein n=1 Tax=Glutamicibacter ardleyensis TaxID=225894 RepID=UPI003FD014ED